MRSLEGSAPELLYNRFTSKDQTSILAQVLKVKVELPRSTRNYLELQGISRISLILLGVY